MQYVETATIKQFAEAPDESSDEIWDILAASASLIFDGASGVAENFFAPAGFNPADKFFKYEPSGFYKLPPFIGDAVVKINETNDTIDAAKYTLSDNILFFNNYLYGVPFPFDTDYFNNFLKISARWGFAETPADVRQAVIEQALFMYRRKDAAFTEISGVSAAVVQQSLAPTCRLVADKYKALYLSVGV